MGRSQHANISTNNSRFFEKELLYLLDDYPTHLYDDLILFYQALFYVKIVQN